MKLKFVFIFRVKLVMSLEEMLLKLRYMELLVSLFCAKYVFAFTVLEE